MAELESVRAKLKAAGQEQLLAFVDKVDNAEPLRQDLEGMDFAELRLFYETAVANHSQSVSGGADSELVPPEPSAIAGIDVIRQDGAAHWEQLGREAISQGKVAVLILGGGAGTRLGIESPKGMFSPPGLPSGKPLYQLFAERCLNLKKSTGAKSLPFLVMTSPSNHDETVEFFQAHAYFGMLKEDCTFFPQGTMPAFTKEGKLILEAPGTLSLHPDGNGGIYPALKKAGVLDKCESLGVQLFHVFGVDNILTIPADPKFVGFCLDKKADVGNKSVWKRDKDERVGVMATRGGKYCVVEYSEISDEQKGRMSSGKLVFGAGNICNHMFSLPFLRDVVVPNMAKQYHVAEKKVPFCNDKGETEKPATNNGIKLESFIFDSFPLASKDKVAIFECLREDEFAPIKNASGADSPQSAVEMLAAKHRRWIEAAGGKIQGDGIVEVSPLVSYAGEGLEELCKGKTFQGGTEIGPAIWSEWMSCCTRR